MQQSMLTINGIQTHVVTEGRWVEEGLSPTGRKDLVLVIPGNPGVPSYYEDFIKSLKSRLPTETPIWVVGHAGHVSPPKNLSISLPEGPSSWKYYSLNGQIEHKVAFIEKYVPKDARIHLVGHSIGCWFILQLLKDKQFADRVVKCYLLFPTIERMKKSPQGYFLSNFVLRIASILLFLCWIFTILPSVIQIILLRTFGLLFGLTQKSVKPTLQLLQPSVLRRVFRLAHEEMQKVCELDHELISKNENKLLLYYGSTDKWTPRYYYDQLKEKYPNINAEMCQRGFYHSFVLNQSEEVGKMVGGFISETLS